MSTKNDAVLTAHRTYIELADELEAATEVLGYSTKYSRMGSEIALLAQMLLDKSREAQEAFAKEVNSQLVDQMRKSISSTFSRFSYTDEEGGDEGNNLN